MALIAFILGVTLIGYGLLQARQGRQGKQRRRDLVLAGLVLVGLGAIMLRPETTLAEVPASPDGVQDTQPAGDPVVLSDLEFILEDNTRYLVGTVRNATDETLDYATFQIDLLNAQNQRVGQVGASYTRVENLAAGEERPFRAWIPQEDAQQVQARLTMAICRSQQDEQGRRVCPSETG